MANKALRLAAVLVLAASQTAIGGPAFALVVAVAAVVAGQAEAIPAIWVISTIPSSKITS